MYKTLIFRSLSRHKKKGRRLFVLMALCSATIILLGGFQPNGCFSIIEIFASK